MDIDQSHLLPPPNVLLRSAKAQVDCANRIKFEDRRMVLNRGLESEVAPFGYANLLGPEFFERVMSLGGLIWWDGGSGHLRAQVDLVNKYRALRLPLPSLVATTTIIDLETIKAMAKLSAVYSQQKEATLTFIRGNIELLRDVKISNVGLGSDVLGDSTYSQHPDRVFAKYFLPLKLGCKIFAYVPGKANLYVSDGNDEHWSYDGLQKWLDSFIGVHSDLNKYFQWGQVISFERLERVVYIPPLKLLLYIPGSPPIRIFEPAISAARPLRRR
ncbi:MAG TPA: hypothetical protein VLJ17_11495 [Xanthobacteraceae bacterium]|nr:hypothetical protein [Xanthobacteraceae bacterium]